MQPIQGSQRQLPPHPTKSNQQIFPPTQRYSSLQYQARQKSLNQLNESNLSLQASASRLSLASNQSMQSMGSSNSMISQPLLPTRTFPVYYNHNKYMVDPFLLMQSSIKFNELIQPFMDGNIINSEAQLEIFVSKFTDRNMNNFLKLCQNMPTDVQNSEMKEICEIAKMFKAEKIYDTGISFIKSYLDPNFNVPDSKYDESNGQKTMIVECESQIIHHVEFTGFEFPNENEDANKKSQKENNSIDAKNNFTKSDDEPPNKHKSLIYHVLIEKHRNKCTVYHFSLKEKVLYSAKQKLNNIYIGSGASVHINKDTSNHVGHIYQDDNKTNFILADKEKFQTKYVNSGRPNHFSLSVTFPHKNKEVTWTPKSPKYDEAKNKYYLNFHGEYHHNPIKSSKNIVLANGDGHTVFIVRKMSEHVFEFESLPSIDPLIIFTIGLSDIVGPYDDEFGGI